MSRKNRRRVLTFTRMQWRGTATGVVGIAAAFREGTPSQPAGKTPLEAAVADLPNFAAYMIVAFWLAAYLTSVRLAIAGVYGLMRPFPALSERRILGGFAHWAAHYLAIIVVSLVFAILARQWELNRVFG
jgi:hypothetical protein